MSKAFQTTRKTYLIGPTLFGCSDIISAKGVGGDLSMVQVVLEVSTVMNVA